MLRYSLIFLLVLVLSSLLSCKGGPAEVDIESFTVKTPNLKKSVTLPLDDIKNDTVKYWISLGIARVTVYTTVNTFNNDLWATVTVAFDKCDLSICKSSSGTSASVSLDPSLTIAPVATVVKATFTVVPWALSFKVKCGFSSSYFSIDSIISQKPENVTEVIIEQESRSRLLIKWNEPKVEASKENEYTFVQVKRQGENIESKLICSGRRITSCEDHQPLENAGLILYEIIVSNPKGESVYVQKYQSWSNPFPPEPLEVVAISVDEIHVTFFNVMSVPPVNDFEILLNGKSKTSFNVKENDNSYMYELSYPDICPNSEYEVTVVANNDVGTTSVVYLVETPTIIVDEPMVTLSKRSYSAFVFSTKPKEGKSYDRVLFFAKNELRGVVSNIEVTEFDSSASCNFEGLEVNAEYLFHVVWVSVCGEFESPTVIKLVHSVPPTGLGGIRIKKTTYTSVTLEWDAPKKPHGEITSYYLSVFSGALIDPLRRVFYELIDEAALFATIDKLTPGATYNAFYTVCNKAISSTVTQKCSDSESFKFVTLDASAPVIPNVTTYGSEGPNLLFIELPEITGSIIEYAVTLTDSYSNSYMKKIVIKDNDARKVTFDNLEAGMEYVAIITATNINNETSEPLKLTMSTDPVVTVSLNIEHINSTAILLTIYVGPPSIHALNRVKDLNLDVSYAGGSLISRTVLVSSPTIEFYVTDFMSNSEFIFNVTAHVNFQEDVVVSAYELRQIDPVSDDSPVVDKGGSSGVIAGVCCSLIVILVVVLIAFFVMRRRKLETAKTTSSCDFIGSTHEFFEESTYSNALEAVYDSTQDTTNEEVYDSTQDATNEEVYDSTQDVTNYMDGECSELYDHTQDHQSTDIYAAPNTGNRCLPAEYDEDIYVLPSECGLEDNNN